MNKYFYVQAQNNAWANYRLGKACLTLPAAEMSKSRTGFFPSIIDTLNHNLTVDWYYVSAFEGQCMGADAFDPWVPFPDIAQLVKAQAEIDQRFIAVCKDPLKSSDETPVGLIRGDTVQLERFDRTFLHLIQHQIHHRGQVHCMLAETAAAPPQLDEFFLGSGADKDLRADDLKALGITEEEIWGDF